MPNQDVVVKWDESAKAPCLVFEFPEQLGSDVADRAIRRWREAFESRPGEQITIVWDCKAMKGYESGARRAWQDAIQEMKGRIAGIWLVSGSAFVRMGAMVMGKAISIPIRTVNSRYEVAA